MTAKSEQPAAPVLLVNDKFGKAVINGCCERRCKLGLVGISNYIILKGEKAMPGQKTCDCVVIHGTSPPRIVFVELKSGGVKSKQVIDKFSNALEFFSHNVIKDRAYDISMLLLVKRRLPKTFYTVIREHGFKLKGKKYYIITLPCGKELADVYKELV